MKIRNKSGFSLIELLTVIAIIAVLAAIIFPVMSTARERGKQAQCISNMNAIQQGLKLYKNDNGRYPALLVGYVEQGVPMDSIANGALFREYVNTAKTFSCPNSLTTDQRADMPDPLAGVAIIGINRPAQVTLGQGSPVAPRLYRYDSYDAQVLRYANTDVQPRYTLGWANTVQEAEALVKIGNPAATPNEVALAFQRQLKFKNPPDDTVVTWCSYHRGGQQLPDGGGFDLVLFLAGNVDRIPSRQMYPNGVATPWNYPYTVKPKP